MEYQHIKMIHQNTIYAKWKKHFCPKCHEILQIIQVSKIVNSNSPESKDFNFSFGESSMIGDVKFIWEEFICPGCELQISIKKLKQLEKEQKRKKHKTQNRI